MKKLFVLFLLVALVPFTVGCSLWGSDDDESIGYPTFLTATVKVPAAGIANLRAASYADFSSYTLTLNGIVLSVDEASSVFTTDPVTLVFKALATQAQINSVQSATVPYTAVLSNGAGSSTTLTINPSAATGVISITVNAAGEVTAFTIGGTDVTEYVGEGTFAIVSVKHGLNSLATSATVGVVDVNDLTPTFVVKFNTNQSLINTATFDVTANSVGGAAAQELSGSMFTLASVVGDDTAISITVNQSVEKFLTVGRTYKVSIKNAKTTDGKVLVPATYYFKAVAQ